MTYEDVWRDLTAILERADYNCHNRHNRDLLSSLIIATREVMARRRKIEEGKASEATDLAQAQAAQAAEGQEISDRVKSAEGGDSY